MTGVFHLTLFCYHYFGTCLDDSLGCKSTFALIEYANNLDIPDEVMEHPSIRSLDEACNDLVTWSNVCSTFFIQLACNMNRQAQRVCHFQDIFSYNVEQSKGQCLHHISHSIIPADAASAFLPVLIRQETRTT